MGDDERKDQGFDIYFRETDGITLADLRATMRSRDHQGISNEPQHWEAEPTIMVWHLDSVEARNIMRTPRGTKPSDGEGRPDDQRQIFGHGGFVKGLCIPWQAKDGPKAYRVDLLNPQNNKKFAYFSGYGGDGKYGRQKGIQKYLFGNTCPVSISVPQSAHHLVRLI